VLYSRRCATRDEISRSRNESGAPGRLDRGASCVPLGDGLPRPPLEAAHLPLYTIWTDGTIRDNAFAVLHCTMGDVDRVRYRSIDAVMRCRRVGHAVTDGSLAAYSSVWRASIGRIVEKATRPSALANSEWSR
jgi:hypothetical protein